MKQRSTTPVLKKLVTKSILVIAAVVLVSAVPFSAVPKVHADQFDDKISALQQQADQYKAQANVLQSKIGTLQDAIAGLQAQQNAIQAQIDLNQAELDRLNQQITLTTQQIGDNKDALGTTLADMYIDNTISPLEMLASSKNIGDYVDKQSYRSSVGDQLQSTIQKINDLKTSLTKAKTSVEKVVADQQIQRDSLVSAKQQQQTLLNETQGEESSYQALISSVQQSIANASAQQAAYYRNLLAGPGGGKNGVVGSFQYTNWSGDQGCAGGYPAKWCFTGDNSRSVDDWQLYNAECVSYVAWKLSSMGKAVYGFQGRGNAYEWPDSARGAQIVSTPQRGDAVILPSTDPGRYLYGFAPIGHAMVVESVNGDWMHVSQYNMYGTHGYSEMDIKNSGVYILRFASK